MSTTSSSGWLIAGLAVLGSGLPAQIPDAKKQTLVFGVYSFKRATEVSKEFEPAMLEIQRGLTQRLGHEVGIQVRIAKTYEEAQEQLVKGEVDFVRFGPASYVLAKQQNPGIELLVAEQEDGQKRCKGVFVVRRDSPIRMLEDLKGKKIAFGDDKSTIGRYLSQAELAKVGLRMTDLAGHKYLDRHDKVAAAVSLGEYDAGPVHIATFESHNAKKANLRVIASFENVGKPWIARAGLDPKVVDALRKTLLELAVPEALEALKVHGLQPVTDSDYQLVRLGMKKAEEFARPLDKPAPAGGK